MVGGVEVRFRLLGDVEVRLDGSAVDVGHARQRCVLVALLVDANRLVPVDRLVDRVWSDRPPRAARNTLAGYVSRLRQSLAPADGVGITRRADGYLIGVDPMTVDLHLFHHLCTCARESGDAGEALAAYERALALWQGEAFAGLATRWLDDLRVRLDAERLEAELERNDLALVQGRHAVLLGELLDRAAAYPLHERLTGQLLLALYRCGRQAEALRRYEQLRLGLADELGADPGPALQRIHRQILTEEADLAPEAAVRSRQPASAAAPVPATTALPIPAGATAPVAVPRQLPAPPGSFTGRDEQLAALDAIATAATQPEGAVVVAVVAGTAGVGKTALAVHWAHRAAAGFADGQLYVDLHGFGPGDAALSPAEAVRAFLEALGVPPTRIPASPDAQVGLYRSLLAGRRMLVVLDNARDAEQVRPLLPGSGGCLVLVTSRDQLTGLVADHDARLLTLDLFTTGEARLLLTRRLGADRIAAEPDALVSLDEIVARCTRLPLALSVVAARAVARPGFPLSALADELAQAASRLDPFAGADRATDARSVFSWSYRTLTADAARLFRLLGLHPGPDTGVAAAASLAGLPTGRVRVLLAELTRAHLLSEPAPGRYACHDLLREYAAEQAHEAGTGDELRTALHRVLDHYLHTAHSCAMLLHPYRDTIPLEPRLPGVTVENLSGSAQALAWFTTERPVLLAAANLAASAGLDVHAWQLAWTTWTFLDRQGHRHDLLAIGRTGLAAANRLDDPAAQAPTHRLLAVACMNLTRYAEAHVHLTRALELYGQTCDVVGEAHTHNNFQTLYERQCLHAEALDHARLALDLYRAAGHRRGEAHGLNAVGWFQSLLGEHEQALLACRQALTLLQDLGDSAGEAYTWDSLGHAHHHLGDQQEALRCLRHAVGLVRDIGDRYHEAHILSRIGDAHHAAGYERGAQEAWKQALDVFGDFDHSDTEQLRAKLAGVPV